MSLKF